MRTPTLFFLLLVLVTTATAGQTIEDTVVVRGGEITKEPPLHSDQVVELNWGDSVAVTSKEENHLKVLWEEKNGWLAEEYLMSAEEKQAYKRGPDTVMVDGGTVRSKPSVTDGIAVMVLQGGERVRVFGRTKNFLDQTYLRVVRQGQVGWLHGGHVMSKEQKEKYRNRIEAQREKFKERQQRYQLLRSEGYTIVLNRQTFSKNTADGISVGLGLANISQSKTVKYAKITWKLFNSVGDPTAGENSGSAMAQTRLVGPLEPQESAYTEFENVWYSPVGSCAEIRGIKVEHIDGSTFTYIDDLKDIAREAESVRLMGNCSYEAQQKRRN